MIIGVPKEIKKDEYRVAMAPAGVHQLKAHGHRVRVEAGAGVGSGISDVEYRRAGAEIVHSAAQIFKSADMIVKVKEPQPSECRLLRPGQLVFTYFHLAADKELTLRLMKSGATAVAYETIEPESGGLPLLTPMSEVAGRMAIQEGAKYLERPMSGRGVLLAGVPGVEPAEVLILGGGVVGANAARIAAGMGARVTVLEVNLDRMRYLDDVLPPNVRTLMSDSHSVAACIRTADLVIGAVLIAGARTPVLVRRKHLDTMKPRAVMVDVAIDQGGCFETSRPTTHSDPVYLVDDIVHYCVANMPGAVSRTSTYALTNVTLPYAVQIADKGLEQAARDDIAIRRGVNVIGGKLVCRAVAEAFRLPCDIF
jgi:alanine dehydrogenase